MNLKEFTEAVDQKADKLDKKELLCFLHNIARKVPEGNRAGFLEILESIHEETTGEKGSPSIKMIMKKADEEEIQKEFNRLKELFDKIEEQELNLHADGYEDYSLGYGDNWVWEYEDAEEISQIYEDAGRLLQRCVNDGAYQTAADIFDLLTKTEVMVENDWDDFSMDVEELVKEKLAALNLANLALYALYAVYQISAPTERAGKIYDCFYVPFLKDIHLEDMLSLGREELQGLPEFWDSWIMLLSDKKGDKEGRLLKEAIAYHKGKQGMLEAARQAYRAHPALYLEALKEYEKSHDYAHQLEIGNEALGKIEKKYILRSQIALKTAEAAVLLGKEEEAEKCWLEAFLSDTTPVNYLRIINESGNPQKYLETIQNAILSAGQAILPVGHGEHSKPASMELCENIVSGIHKDILQFLSGDFDTAMAQCCKRKEPLGWSGSFVKCGIALFLLLLLEGDEWKQGCAQMAENLLHYLDFQAEKYLCGTKQLTGGENSAAVAVKDMELFKRCFLQWKSGCHLAEEQGRSYLSKLEGLIDKRVKAIVSGQHRYHYGSVAALAAALGEVKESMGITGEKQRILQKYKDEFPRHSSFRAELRRYGMYEIQKGRKI